MNLTNLKGLPDALVQAVRNDPYAGGGDISTTKLIDAPQRRVLYKKYSDFVVEDVSDRIWSLLGQAVHTVLERAETTALTEKRLFAEVNGWSVSGAFDRLHLGDELLQDYKVTSTYNAQGSESWTKQLNVLRWLAHENGYEVSKLQIVAIFRDWSRAKVRDGYPESNVGLIDVPLWDLDDTREYIEERVYLHQRASDGDEIPCTDSERWYEGTTYALKKKGGVRATKVVENIEDLGEIQDGYEVEVRPGEYKRCASFCDVAPFCKQFKQSKDSKEEVKQ